MERPNRLSDQPAAAGHRVAAAWPQPKTAWPAVLALAFLIGVGIVLERGEWLDRYPEKKRAHAAWFIKRGWTNAPLDIMTPKEIMYWNEVRDLEALIDVLHDTNSTGYQRLAAARRAQLERLDFAWYGLTNGHHPYAVAFDVGKHVAGLRLLLSDSLNGNLDDPHLQSGQ